MKFIGADLHKKSITFCVLAVGTSGKLELVTTRRLLCSDPEQISSFLRDQGPATLVVEATIGFDWFAALAEEICHRVVIAHPGRMRVIAESTRKSDKIDARTLAEFLAKDMIPEAWRPTPRVRQHRSLVRYRHRLVRRQTAIRNTVRGILSRYNADRKELFSRAGWSAALRTNLHDAERWILQQHKEELDLLEQRILLAETKILEFAATATIAEREARAVLATMPGVGPVTLEVILAELGDWRRFRNAATVISFAGLDPGVRESDQTRHQLRITKAGSPLLRFILIQLAHRLKRTSIRWEHIFTKLEKRVGNKKATCAVARRLLVTLYAMLRDGRAYELPATTAAAG